MATDDRRRYDVGRNTNKLCFGIPHPSNIFEMRIKRLKKGSRSTMGWDRVLRGTAFGAPNHQARRERKGERSRNRVLRGTAFGAPNHQARRERKGERGRDRVLRGSAFGAPNHQARRGRKGRKREEEGGGGGVGEGSKSRTFT